jgi:hypothetical protein
MDHQSCSCLVFFYPMDDLTRHSHLCLVYFYPMDDWRDIHISRIKNVIGYALNRSIIQIRILVFQYGLESASAIASISGAGSNMRVFVYPNLEIISNTFTQDGQWWSHKLNYHTNYVYFQIKSSQLTNVGGTGTCHEIRFLALKENIIFIHK